MKKTSALLWVAVAGALACSGCGQVMVTTDVKADGSWTRTLKFSAPAPDKEGLSTGPKLEDVFALPSGAQWKTKRQQVDGEIVYTAERTLRKGERLQQDFVLKGKGKAPMGRLLVNEVTVREVAPGRLEYQELLRWQGERPKEFTTPDPEMLQDIKGALPAPLATDANARDLSQIILRELWRMLFGPGDPLLSQMLMHPGLAERRLKQRIGVAVNRALQEKFGERMTTAEQLAVTRKIAETAQASGVTEKAKPKPSPEMPEEKASAMVPLTFVVRLPGAVVETNGELDEVSGEVFWALYPEAAAPQDVVMRATCDVGK